MCRSTVVSSESPPFCCTSNEGKRLMDHDLAIVGGGLAGSALGMALAKAGASARRRNPMDDDAEQQPVLRRGVIGRSW
jgi:hypothetical protein